MTIMIMINIIMPYGQQEHSQELAQTECVLPGCNFGRAVQTIALLCFLPGGSHDMYVKGLDRSA